MNDERVREIQQVLEACLQTDTSDVEAEKTAVIGELLGELERIEIPDPYLSGVRKSG